jgi:hypothetical protein
MLTLPHALRLNPAQFAEVCATNPETVLEVESDGILIEKCAAPRPVPCGWIAGRH